MQNYEDVPQFRHVDVPEELLQIIISRLPKSAHIYNMVQMYSSFPTEMTFYRLLEKNKNEVNACWILVKFVREDKGHQFLISAPNDLEEIPNLIQKAFESISSEILNWNQQFQFVGLDSLVITQFISGISLLNGNVTEIAPTQFFYYPREKLAERNLSTIPKKFALKSLTVEDIKCLLGPHYGWNERVEQYQTKCVARCAAVGAYLHETGEVVSCAAMSPVGHIGILTLEKFQRQGFSHACSQELIELLCKETQLIPCSMVYLKNERSIKCHLKAGYKPTHYCYFVICKKIN